MPTSRNVIRVLVLMVLVGAVFAGKKEEKKESAAAEEGGAKASGDGGSFDITKLGASGDGKTDSTKVIHFPSII